MATQREKADRVEPASDTGDEVRILNLLAVLVRRWRVVLGSTAGGLLLGLLALLLWPREYLAETVLVPSTARQEGIAGQLLSSQIPPAFLGSAANERSEERLIGSVLKSRALTDSVVARLGYRPYTDSEGENEIRHILRRRTDLARDQDGSVVIRVRYSDAERAASVANSFAPVINEIISGVVADASRQRQLYLRARLSMAHEELQESEQELLAFQQSQGAPEIQEQARQTLQAAAELRQRIIEQELIVDRLQRIVTPDHPDLQAANAELAARKAQLSRLTRASGLAGDVFVPFGESAQLGVNFTRLLRNYTTDEQVYLSLTRALAEAQVDPSSDLPVLSVLDPAIVPRRPVRPRFDLLLLFAVFVGLVVGVGCALAQEYFVIARRDPENAPFFAALDRFNSDIRRLMSRSKWQTTSGADVV